MSSLRWSCRQLLGSYENLTKYIRFQVGTLFAWILTFLGAALFNILGGVPVQPLQVLLVKFSIVLGQGNPKPDVMRQPPRDADESIMPMRMAVSLGVSGLIRAASDLGAVVFALTAWASTSVAQSMAIVTFNIARIFLVLECNDQLRSAFSHETLGSGRLIRMIGWSLLLVFLVTSLDFMHRPLAATDLTLSQWVACIVFGSAVLWTSEIEKVFRRRARATEPARRPAWTAD